LRESYLAGKVEYSVIDRHVGFDLVDDDSLLVLRSFVSGLD
jgi:hypothetical protein